MTPFDKLIKRIAIGLKHHSWQIVTAESCTGGLLASYLTEIPGSSHWFDRGYVTYSNQAKQDMLSVSPSLIEKHGAVSEEVARAMAHGALSEKTKQIAVAITGIAGPHGGTIHKPVGTICFAWACNDFPMISTTKHFSGSRQSIRVAACEQALMGILNLF